MLGFHEGGRFREVVDHKGRLSVAVVHGREGGEALLAGGVPDFELDGAIWKGGFLREKGRWWWGQCESGFLIHGDRICGIAGGSDEAVGARERERHTTNGGLLVLLKIIIDEAED